MKFKKIRLKNIRSYESQEIDFPEGSLLLSGDVGSGKSTILLAIEYALFGLQPGQKGASLLRNNCDTGDVALELEIDGREVIIERRLRRSSKTVSNEHSVIIIDGEKVESSIIELKTKILRLLGYPPEFIKKNNLLYKYTVYTPQEQMKQIVLEDPEVRLNILRHIFGIDKYKKIRENVQILLTFLKEESKVLQGEIKTIDRDKTTLQSTKALIGVLEKRINEKDSELGISIKQRKSIEDEVQELESKIKEKENFEKEVEKTKILLTTKKENLSSTNREIEDICRSISEIGETFDESRYKELLLEIEKTKNRIEELNSKNMDLASEINHLKQLKKENESKKERVFSIKFCPTCLQDVPDFHKHTILIETEKVLASISPKIDFFEKDKSEVMGLIEKDKSLRNALEDKKVKLEILNSKTQFIERSKSKLKELEKQKENLEKDLSLLSRHVDSLKEDVLKFSKFNNLYKIKQDELKKAFEKEKNLAIAIAEFKKELQMTHREISNLELVIAEKEKSKSRLSEMLELSDWLSNQFIALIGFVERNVLMKLRIEFSKLFSKWFHMMVAEDSLQVHLDENFTPLITQGETEMDYSFLSGGERTSVALAYRLALNQTINSVLSRIKTGDIVILDEPTDGFSEAQLEKMREVFNELKIGQLIIVSHEQKIEGFVDNVIRLRKDSDASSVDFAAVAANQKT